jgi:hypothetical protein
VSGACSPNGGQEKCVYVIGGKARGKEATRMTKTQVCGYFRDRVVRCGLE